MQRFFFFFCAFFFFTPSIFAQDFEVHQSPLIEMSWKKSFQKHLFSDETGHYLYFMGYKKKVFSVVLEKFSPDFQQSIFSREFQAPDGDMHSIGVEYLDGQFVVILSKVDKKNSTMRYSLTPVSMEGEVGEPITLASVPMRKKKEMPLAKWAVSKDTGKLFFAAYPDKNKRDVEIDMVLTVIDHTLQSVWEKRIQLSYSEVQFDLQSLIVDSDGTAYALAKVYRGNQESNIMWSGEDMVVSYLWKAFRFSPDATKPTSFTLEMDDAFVKWGTFGLAPEGYLASVGLFSDDLKKSIQGALLIKWDPVSGEVIQKGEGSLPAKDLAWMDETNARKKKKENGFKESFLFGDIHFDADGQVVTTAKQRYAVTSSTGSGSSTTTYYSKYVLFFHFDTHGALKHGIVIPKYQSSSQKMRMGHNTLRSNGKTYLFYNDEPENLEMPLGEDPGNFGAYILDTVPIVASVDDNGKVKRRSLIESDDDHLLFVESMCSPLSDSSLFFGATKFYTLFTTKLRMGWIEVGGK